MPLCVDLFSGKGGFSSAFADDPDWSVITVDIDPEFSPDIVADVSELSVTDLPEAEVYVASPPCHTFSTAGKHEHWDGREPATDTAKRNVMLATHGYRLAQLLSTEYWFVENPVGRLRWFLPGEPNKVTYCQYGTEYQKPTHLWGDHPACLEYQTCPAGAGCHARNTHDDGSAATRPMPDDPAERAKVPYPLSQAIKDAVESDLRQATLNDDY